MHLLALLLPLSLMACGSDKDSTPSQPQQTEPLDTGTWSTVVDADGDGITVRDGDCDDNNPSTLPFAPEQCNGVDDNCNGLIDDGIPDNDADGLANCLDTESCDGIDNDGNGLIDDGLPDADADGIADCRDQEACDGLDNNGDGVVDENQDVDGDGFLPCGEAPDCDDANTAIFPGADEASDAIDNDCDGYIDESDWSVGSVVITEIMSNPYTSSDFEGSWIELYNASGRTLSINGLSLSGQNTVRLPESNRQVRFLPNTYIVIGMTTDNLLNGGIEPDALATGLILSNEAGFLSIVEDGQVIDTVQWDGGSQWPDPNGASFALDPYFIDATDNDNVAFWCTGSTAWAPESDLGTPGAPNLPCPSFDHDEDGYTGEEGDCDDTLNTIFPGAEDLWYDGIDGNCDGLSDYDSDLDGVDSTSFGGLDCDDLDASINPDAPEICDPLNIDENCNGAADEDDAQLSAITVWSPDADQDGYGDALTTQSSCDGPSSWVDNSLDCDDTLDTVSPAATEICGNGIDDNCDNSRGSCGVGGITYNTDADGTITENTASVALAASLSSVGDLDGDGMMELILGATGKGNSVQGGGYVMSSALWGSVDSGNALINIIGESNGDQAGWAVAGSEDVDGDGIVDMWISAPSTDGGSFDVGGAYLISGTETGTLRLAQATTTVYGDDSSGRAGEGMATAGDIDEDGLADLWIGAPDAGAGRRTTGQVFLMTAISGQMVTSDAALTLNGENNSDRAGMALSGGVDADGDGTPDVLIGASAYRSGASAFGKVYFVSGTTTASALSSADASWTGLTDGDEAGKSVAFAGDVNGDGYEDMVAGAPADTSQGTGYAYLVLGPFSGSSTFASAIGVISATAAQQQVGVAVSSGGDVDGDGYGDFLVGAPTFDGVGRDSGTALLLYGPFSGSTTVEEIEDQIRGNAINAQLGKTLAGGFDANADGFSDFLIGSTQINSQSGEAYLFYGGEGY